MEDTEEEIAGITTVERGGGGRGDGGGEAESNFVIASG